MHGIIPTISHADNWSLAAAQSGLLPAPWCSVCPKEILPHRGNKSLGFYVILKNLCAPRWMLNACQQVLRVIQLYSGCPEYDWMNIGRDGSWKKKENIPPSRSWPTNLSVCLGCTERRGIVLGCRYVGCSKSNASNLFPWKLQLSTATLFDGANFQLQNTVFQHSHHH